MFGSTIAGSHVQNNNNTVINSGNTRININFEGEQGRDAERSKILEWISRVPFEEHHWFFRQLRQDGTGKWLLEKRDYIQWINSTSSILWLRGNAGAGKTTLVSFIIDSFKTERSINQAVTYFYCRNGEKDRQDPVSILNTLVKQLSLIASPKGPLPQSVVSIFKGHESKYEKLPLSASQKLIASLAESFAQTIIVIDALDECDKESRKQILNSLDIIRKSSTGVIKFFVTSRPADDIELKLEGVPNVYIHSSDNSGDIAAFVKAEVDKCVSEKSLLRGSVKPELKEFVIEKLTSGADGMFLWVSLQIKGICEEKTQVAIEKALQQLPEGLNSTYSIIWDKICQQGKRNQILAERTLKWVMCAQSPLAEAEIIDAVSIEPMDFIGNQDYRGIKVQDLLDVCQNLIVMDEQLGVLRTAHFSVNEFLEDHFEITEAHNHAAEICLTLMSRPKIYDEPPMPPNPSSDDFDRFKESYHYNYERFYGQQTSTSRPKIYDEPHPLRYYMFDHWAYHLRFSGDASNSLLEFQKAFFNASPTFYAWLQEAGKQWEVFRPMVQDDKLTPLWVASYYQLPAIFKTLLRSNVDNPNVHNEQGQTPLYWAAHFGNEEIVQLLLEKQGVDIISKDDLGATPLWAAARGGHEKVVKLFLGRVFHEREGVHMNSKPTSGKNRYRPVRNGHVRQL
ncbi:hypothetical protein RUND412_006680 [Rhizina undulata]